MDQWTVDPSKLKQDYDELKAKYEAFTKLMADHFMKTNKGMIKLQTERDELRAEVERLQKYPAVSSAHIPIFGQLDGQTPKLIRPEPSRLEIAAQLVAGRFSNTTYVTKVSGDWIKYALDGADALIAAAKEVTK